MGEDIFSTFLGCQVFSVIDLVAAYQQISLHLSYSGLAMAGQLETQHSGSEGLRE
jgi:hypothetical protein